MFPFKMVMDTKEKSNKIYEDISFLNITFFLSEEEQSGG